MNQVFENFSDFARTCVLHPKQHFHHGYCDYAQGEVRYYMKGATITGLLIVRRIELNGEVAYMLNNMSINSVVNRITSEFKCWALSMNLKIFSAPNLFVSTRRIDWSEHRINVDRYVNTIDQLRRVNYTSKKQRDESLVEIAQLKREMAQYLTFFGMDVGVAA